MRWGRAGMNGLLHFMQSSSRGAQDGRRRGRVCWSIDHSLYGNGPRAAATQSHEMYDQAKLTRPTSLMTTWA